MKQNLIVKKMAKSNFNLQERITNNSVFTIGNVLSVKGQNIVIKVNKDKNLPHLFFQGKTIKNVSVGLSNYVKILKGFTVIIAKVEGEYLEADKRQSDKKYINEKQKINRFLNVSVFGFYDDDHRFQHGIKEMPLIGSECKLLSRDEFERLHQLSDGKELSIPIGSLIDEETQEISVAVDKLFAGHIGIFGNTGSGKSNTLAKMYTELFRLDNINDNFNSKSKFIIIDFNGEYSKEKEEDHILTDKKTVYRLRTRDDSGSKYPISRLEIEKLELLSILLDATEKTQQPFLHRAIDRDWFDKGNENFAREIYDIKKKIKEILIKNDPSFNKPFLEKFVKDFQRLGFQIISKENLDTIGYNAHITSRAFYLINNPDSPIYINTSNIDNLFDSEKCIFKISLPNGMTELQHIQFKIFDEYYYEVIHGYANQEHINPLMNRIQKRFSALEKVIAVKPDDSDIDNVIGGIEVVNLRDVNIEIKKIIPMLICKSNYDIQKNLYSTKQHNSSLHIIIDEAHNILSDTSARETSSWKDYRLETFEEIIKEGRKFGVFVTIASQRPSDISATMISQLHNYFIHKLMNDDDLQSIKRAVSYLDRLSFDSISNLSIGCCFIAGQLTQFPLSVKVQLLVENERPQSETISLEKLWGKLPENQLNPTNL